MPPAIPLILAGIQAAITAAPQVEDLVVAGKQLITALFTAKLITQDVQKMLHDWVDNQASLAAKGIVPPSWQVRPDPQA